MVKKQASSNKEPLVSVLLSIYKVEEYLEECLDSILVQSYKNLEIVCVDNGSPDNCGEILKKYALKDKRIEVVTLKENKFLCGGRNAGLDNATGEFVCFVDPDDWIEKDYIKVMVDTIQTKTDSNGKPYNLIINYNAVNYMVMPDKSIKKIYTFATVPGEKNISYYNKDNSIDVGIPMWGRLYRKSFLDENKDIRFLDGVNIDNIPFTLKLFSLMQKFFVIIGEKNAIYWRRLITPEGAITVSILYKDLEIPNCLDNLYEFLKNKHLEKKVRIMYHWFFTVCFPRHIDQPRYYQKFRDLMIKMEDVIKTSGIYPPEDINLCNLLIYSNGFYDFLSRYFAPIQTSTNDTKSSYVVKLFDQIPIMKIYKRGNKKKYSLFKLIPVWEQKKKGTVTYYKLFGLPFLKIKQKI